MGIGTSDGKYYDAEHEWLMDSQASLGQKYKDLPFGERFGDWPREEINRLFRQEYENTQPRRAVAQSMMLIRHGSTELNAENGGGSVDRIRGHEDVPLSEKGREEARATAKELKNSNLDVLVSSDLSRAADTASEIGRTLGIPIYFTDKLRPWNLGNLQGQASKDAHPIICKHCIDQPDTPVPGGESFNDFKNRAAQGVREAQAMGNNVGIVTHHRVERFVNAHENGSFDTNEFLKKGEAPGSTQEVNPSVIDTIERLHNARKNAFEDNSPMHLLNKPNIEGQNEIPKIPAAPIAQKYMDMPESKNVEDRRYENQLPVMIDYLSKEYSGLTTDQWKYVIKELSTKEGWFSSSIKDELNRRANYKQRIEDKINDLGDNPLSEKAGFKDIKVK